MIYDFHELLGRGIIAARTNRMEEAVDYLILAGKIEPENTRVLLWLAASAESLEQKRQLLERALQIDPHLLPARALLERLKGNPGTVERSPADFAVFTCPHCGGKQRFDPDLSGLICNYCKQIEFLRPAKAAFQESQLDSEIFQNSGNWAIWNSEFACSACGAKVSLPADQGTMICPFCDSDQIALQPATPDLVTPTAILPFQLHAEDVKGILQHADMRRGLELDSSLTPIYLPFWTFDGRVQIRCALEYRVPAETFSKHDRVFIEEDWPRQTSWYECKLDDLLVYAGRAALTSPIAEILPFDLTAVLEYHPQMLAGWQAELYQIALDDASVEALQKMRTQAFRFATKRRLFMRESRLLPDDIRVLDRTYKLLFLPVWIVRASKSGGVHIMINGQTGKIASSRHRRKLGLW